MKIKVKLQALVFKIEEDKKRVFCAVCGEGKTRDGKLIA